MEGVEVKSILLQEMANEVVETVSVSVQEAEEMAI
jgi:hypothetical protein